MLCTSGGKYTLKNTRTCLLSLDYFSTCVKLCFRFVFTLTSSRLDYCTFLQTVGSVKWWTEGFEPDEGFSRLRFESRTLKIKQSRDSVRSWCNLFIKFCLIRRNYILCEVFGSEDEISRQLSSDRTLPWCGSSEAPSDHHRPCPDLSIPHRLTPAGGVMVS